MRNHHTGRAATAVLPFVFLLLLLSSCSIHTDDTATIVLGDSLIYRGQLKDGKPEGLGVLMHGDSVIYSGNWHLGKRQGTGSVTDSHGRSISGKWYADTIVSGVFRDSAGVYTGEMNNALRPNGYGHYRDTLGTYYEGQWNDGERTGFGFSSQHRYFRVGEWKHDVYKGERLNYNAERIYGIDVSKYQHIHGNAFHTIDWNRLRITNLGTLSKKNVSGNVDYKVSFVFIKSTEGASMLNPYYHSDYAAARRNGYAVGTYHYFSHRSSGTQQAWYFLSHSHFRKGDLPPVLDLEPLPSQVQKMGGVGTMWKRVRAWLDIVERKTGMRPILYISQTFVNRWLDYAPDVKHNYPIWIARYGEYKPDIKLRIWQLAPDGKVRGIAGHTDINVFNGYEKEFEQWKREVSME